MLWFQELKELLSVLTWARQTLVWLLRRETVKYHDRGLRCNWRDREVEAKLRKSKIYCRFMIYIMTSIYCFALGKYTYILILAFVMVLSWAWLEIALHLQYIGSGPCCCSCGDALPTTPSGPSRSGRWPSICSWTSSSCCRGVYWDSSVLETVVPTMQAKVLRTCQQLLVQPW